MYARECALCLRVYSLLQATQRSLPLPPRDVVVYGLRWLACLLLMELSLAFVPVFAAAKTRLYEDWSSVDVALFAYCKLHIIWLKFLVCANLVHVRVRRCLWRCV
jgi:hypothetical protein